MTASVSIGLVLIIVLLLGDTEGDGHTEVVRVGEVDVDGFEIDGDQIAETVRDMIRDGDISVNLEVN